MIEKIKEFILIAKKLLVLRKEDTTTEPKVSLLFNSNNEAFLTFFSSVFPFFSHPGFEEVEEKDLDNFLDKCRNYLKDCENFYTVDLGLSSKNNQIAEGESFFISKNGEITKYTVKRDSVFYNGVNKGYCRVIEERLNN